MTLSDQDEAFVGDVKRSLDLLRRGSPEGLPDEVEADDYDIERVDREPTTPPVRGCCYVDEAGPCGRDADQWMWDPTLGVYEERCPAHGLGYRIRSEEGASKAMWNWRSATADKETIEKLFEAELATLKRWRDDALAIPKRRARFYEVHLVRWLRGRQALNDKRKSLPYPGGKIRSRAGSVGVEIVDKPAFVAWAAAKPEVAAACLRYNEPDILISSSGDKVYPGLKSILGEQDGELAPILHDDQDGEKIPGIKVERAETSYWVEKP